MGIYDSNGDGFVDSFEIGYMLSDVYRAMNKGFNPTPTDIASYTRVIDSNFKKFIQLLQKKELEEFIWRMLNNYVLNIFLDNLRSKAKFKALLYHKQTI